MSEFTTLLTNVNSEATYAAAISSASAHQGTQEHNDVINALITARKSKSKMRIVQRIEDHFNNVDINKTDIQNTELSFDISELTESELADLDTVMQGKGYTCTLNGKICTIDKQ